MVMVNAIAGGRGSQPSGQLFEVTLGGAQRDLARIVPFRGIQRRVSAVVALAHAGWLRSGWVRRGAFSRTPACCLAFFLDLRGCAGCAVGPDYLPEAAPTPTNFKELKGWKVATPSDALDRGEWWALYRDPKLAFLIKQVEISNQTVAAAGRRL